MPRHAAVPRQDENLAPRAESVRATPESKLSFRLTKKPLSLAINMLQLCSSLSKPPDEPPPRRARPAAWTLAATLVATLIAAPAPAQVPPQWRAEFPMTDFETASVDLSEIISGGPPRDGIPAISEPTFLAAAEETRIDPREPVMTFEAEGATPRAYPIR